MKFKQEKEVCRQIINLQTQNNRLEERTTQKIENNEQKINNLNNELFMLQKSRQPRSNRRWIIVVKDVVINYHQKK